MGFDRRGPTRILIADDHGPLRKIVRRLLTEDSSMDVVGDVSSGVDAVEAATRLRPDVVLLDGNLPGFGGSDAATQISELVGDSKCILLSLSHERAYIVQALRAGAWGFISKHDAPDHLLDGVKAVLRGECFLSPTACSAIDGNTLSAEAWGELSGKWTLHASALFRFGLASGASPESVLEALTEILGVYATLAVHGSLPVEGFTVWMIVSLTSILFDLQRGPEPVDSAHPSHRDLIGYWRGMRESKRQRIREHVAECRACHLDWSTVALLPSEEDAPWPRLEAVPERVLERLATNTPAESFADVIEHESRMRALASAQRAVLLGHCSGRSPRPTNKRRNSSVTLVGEFLGRRAVTQAYSIFGVL